MHNGVNLSRRLSRTSPVQRKKLQSGCQVARAVASFQASFGRYTKGREDDFSVGKLRNAVVDCAEVAVHNFERSMMARSVTPMPGLRNNYSAIGTTAVEDASDVRISAQRRAWTAESGPIVVG
jgi:hypothetical protein